AIGGPDGEGATTADGFDDWMAARATTGRMIWPSAVRGMETLCTESDAVKSTTGSIATIARTPYQTAQRAAALLRLNAPSATKATSATKALCHVELTRAATTCASSMG